MDERERWVGGRRRQRKVKRKEGSGWAREREVGSEELKGSIHYRLCMHNHGVCTGITYSLWG